MKFKSLLCLVLCMCMLVGCGTAGNTQSGTQKESEKLVDKEVEITVPASFYEDGITEEELQNLKEENGFIDAKLNEDGSVTFVMLESVQKKYLEDLKTAIRESCDELINEMEAISAIEYNDDVTSFTITTSSESVTLVEAAFALGLLTSSGMYHVFSGAEVDNIHIEYVNVESGEVIHSIDSKDLASET